MILRITWTLGLSHIVKCSQVTRVHPAIVIDCFSSLFNLVQVSHHNVPSPEAYLNIQESTREYKQAQERAEPQLLTVVSAILTSPSPLLGSRLASLTSTASKGFPTVPIFQQFSLYVVEVVPGPHPSLIPVINTSKLDSS